MAGIDLEGEFDLERLGLPIANEVNKQLEAEVQRKEREIASLQLNVEEHKDRVQAIGDHLKNVRQELQQTQVCSPVLPESVVFMSFSEPPMIIGGIACRLLLIGENCPMPPYLSIMHGCPVVN